MIDLYQLSQILSLNVWGILIILAFLPLVNMSWIGWVNQWEVFRTLKCLHERLFENYVLSAIFLRNRLDLETKPSIFDAKKKKKRLWFRPTYKLADFFKKIPSFSFLLWSMVSFINPKHTFTAGENQVKLRGHGNGFCDFENDKKPKEHVIATIHSFFLWSSLDTFWGLKWTKM